MSRLLYRPGLVRVARITRLRFALVSLVGVLCSAGLAVAPQYAAAEASAGPAPATGPSGLPDGRVYEQASPTNKFGNEAGASLSGTPPYMVAGTGGDEVAYFNTGPLGETPTGFDYFSIARRFPTGWRSRGAVSRGEGVQGAFKTNPQSGLGFSSEMTSSVFGAPDVFVAEQEPSSATPHLYRYNEDGSVQWLGKPTIAEPLKFEGFDGLNEVGELAGGSSSFGTIYYGFEGTLTAADEEPNPALGGVSRAEEIGAMDQNGAPLSDNGFYEWHEGTLESAGVLPDGRLDPYGASPAATVDERNYSAEALRNQVSEDGREAFFISPDPGSESGRPSELYVRETAADGSQSTVLVSRDLLLPQVGGQPAGAPSGASFSYASSDGSHVFFQSASQLTPEAPSGESTVKAYVFDTETNTLAYLPGVADWSAECNYCTLAITAASRDGSDFLFVREAENFQEGRLEVWSEGKLTEIGPLFEGRRPLALARASVSGSVFVFQSSSPFTALKFNNGEGAYEEIYRYEVATSTLTCLSCPPQGIVPTGNAALSHAFPKGDLGNTFLMITGNRGISEDGGRVYFDTPDALVPQDTNGVRDAYEWENGTLYLISTGVSQLESFFGDNSPSGNDVFFSTAEGLAPGDSDEGYDVYDARVPRPGDQLPPGAVPCEGAVCQGPPSVPQLLSVPASAAFEGIGELAPLKTSQKVAKRSLTRMQRLRRALRACRRERNVRRRARCVHRARKRHGAKASSTGRNVNHGDRRHNGRGK